MARQAILALLALAGTSQATAQNDAYGPPAPADAPFAIRPALPDGTPADIAELDFSTPVTTLTDAIERAYWANPTLLAERSTTRAADYRLYQARARYGPTLSYELRRGYQRDNIESPLGGYFARSGWTTTAAAILTQPVFTFGQLAAGKRGAQAEVEFQQAGLRVTEQQVLFATISAYVAVLRERAALDIARDNLGLLERELSDLTARYTVRESTIADLEQVRTRTELARAELLVAQAALADSEAGFRAVTGSPAGELAPPNPLQFPATTLDGAQALADRTNPLLAAAFAREKISRAARDAAIAAQLPRVELQGRGELGTQTPYNNDFRQNTVVGQVVVSGPLLSGGLLAARELETRAANDADWRLIDGSRRDLQAEVRSAWAARSAQRDAVANLAEAVAAAQNAYDGALIQQRAGFRTTLDVLILARELLNARTTYNQTVANAYLSEARLLLAMGVLEHGYLLPDAPQHDSRELTRKAERYEPLPPFTPIIGAIDGIGWGTRKDRALRDPAASPDGGTVQDEASQ